MNDLKDLVVKNLKFVVASAVVGGAIYFLMTTLVFKVEEQEEVQETQESAAPQKASPTLSKKTVNAPELQSMVEVVPKKADSVSSNEKPELPIYNSDDQGVGAAYSVSSNKVNTAEYESRMNDYYDQSYQPPLEAPTQIKKDPESVNPVLASFFDTSVLVNKPSDEDKKKDAAGGGGSGGGESSATVISVTADKPAGTYGSAPEVTLTFLVNSQPSTEGSIFYCIKEGGDCCELDAVTSTYTAPIDLGSEGDGKYCLTFYGKSFSGLSTQPSDLHVTIDSVFPSIPITATETYYTQTTERFSFRFPRITYPATPAGLILSLYALDDDPTESPNCIQVAKDNAALNLDGVPGPDYLDFAAYLASYPLTPVNLYIFYYNFPKVQTYYIVTTVTKPHLDGALSSCSVTKVVVEDFLFFSSLPIKSKSTSGVSQGLVGGFTPFSFFKSPPTTTDQSGKGKDGELHSSFFDSLF